MIQKSVLQSLSFPTHSGEIGSHTLLCFQKMILKRVATIWSSASLKQHSTNMFKRVLLASTASIANAFHKANNLSGTFLPTSLSPSYIQFWKSVEAVTGCPPQRSSVSFCKSANLNCHHSKSKKSTDIWSNITVFVLHLAFQNSSILSRYVSTKNNFISWSISWPWTFLVISSKKNYYRLFLLLLIPSGSSGCFVKQGDGEF